MESRGVILANQLVIPGTLFCIFSCCSTIHTLIACTHITHWSFFSICRLTGHLQVHFTIYLRDGGDSQLSPSAILAQNLPEKTSKPGQTQSLIKSFLQSRQHEDKAVSALSLSLSQPALLGLEKIQSSWRAFCLEMKISGFCVCLFSLCVCGVDLKISFVVIFCQQRGSFKAYFYPWSCAIAVKV